MITLTIAETPYPLPSCYCWSDEFAWSAKSQIHTRLLPQDGQSALLIQETVKTGGQPLTLASDDGPGMMTRGLLDDLIAAAAVSPSPVVTVAMTGRATLTALFDYSRGVAIEGAPVLAKEPPADDDLYWVTLHLIKL